MMKRCLAILFLTICVYPVKVNAGGISTGAAVVMESENDQLLYERNAHVRMRPASTTKLMTAIVVLETIDPDAVIIISKRAASTPSVTPPLRSGERFTVKDLLYLALMRSVNGAAVALAEEVAGSEEAFVKIMNEKVAALGLKNTHFVNASGLPSEGQHITAYDLAKIMKKALKMPLLDEIMNTRVKEISSLGGRRIFLKNTNQLLWADGGLVIGKTGYTRAAKHCFVCSARKGGNIIIVALLGMSRREELWSQTEILLSRVSLSESPMPNSEVHVTQRQ